MRGFAPLASDFNFSDLQKAIDEGRIADFSGVAPYGRLTPSYLRGKKLRPLLTAERTVLNLILYDGSTIREVFYLRLRNVEAIENGRRGWLVDGGGSMVEYLRTVPEAGLALSVLQGRTDNIDLGRPSPFIFIDMPAPSMLRPKPSPATLPTAAPPAEDVSRVDRIAVGSIDWRPGSATLHIFIYLSGARPPDPGTNVRVERGKLIVSLPAEHRFASAGTHPYLDAHAEGNELIIGISNRAKELPIASFVEAALPTPAVIMTERGLRMQIDVIAAKREDDD